MARSHQPVELWAGIECTHNRVGDRRFDQLDRTRHRDRIEDLDALRDLGIRAVRYPVLWEHVYGDDGTRRDWRWHDERLQRMRDLGMTPVVGLLHHGAGPGNEGFAHPRFAERFAAFAREVAERYPWIDRYIPVNEPLTTARFSGLYGVWHPHARDPEVFAQILIAQLRGTVLAMQAIREVTPGAQLIQNEDIGFMRAVPRLQYQADFENERRWVTFDLLCGRLREGMPMWDYLTEAGVTANEIAWFAERATPPDLLAIDTYITGQRFADDHLDRYPEWSHGTNGRDRYADIEAVRVTEEEPVGILTILRQAWDRYRMPMVVGEWHLGCTREEQMRWLRDGWDSVHIARDEQIDVRALTIWSAFGSYDWNTLVTQENGYYEPGLFDVRSDPPRPTALSTMARALADGAPFDHPGLDSDGWWRRDDRILYGPVAVRTPVPHGEPALPKVDVTDPRHLVLTGARGPVADGFARVCAVRGLPHLEAGSAEAGDPAWLNRSRAWAVVDIGVCGRADVAARAGRSRIDETEAAAAACAAAEIPFIVFSCWHAARGLGPCGSTSAARERVATRTAPDALLVRPGVIFGPWDPHDPALRRLGRAASPHALDERLMSPAYLPDVVNAALELIIDGEHGLWELDHGVQTTWDELSEALRALANGADPGSLVTFGHNEHSHPLPLPALVDAMTRFLRETEHIWRPVTEGAPAEVVELDSAPGHAYPASEPASTLARAQEGG